jgi:hypothetical protein
VANDWLQIGGKPLAETRGKPLVANWWKSTGGPLVATAGKALVANHWRQPVVGSWWQSLIKNTK